MKDILKREIEDLIAERIAETPVLLLQGPRSVGKSTLIKAISKSFNSELIDFDDENVIELFKDIGAEFLPSGKTVFIDEYQKAPNILSFIKHRLNSSSNFGQFVISGSTTFDALPKGTQSLTGRIDRLNILPLTQSEILQTNKNFINRLVDNPIATINTLNGKISKTSYQDYMKKVAIGGFPLSIKQTNQNSRSRWFKNYIEYSVNHDIPEIMRIRQYAEMRNLINRLTKSSASVLNISKVCADIDLPFSSVQIYISLLEKIFMIHLLYPSTAVKTDRLLKRPKLHFLDSGIATHLMGLDEESILSISKTTSTNNGHLIESFVVNEIIRLSTGSSAIRKIGYWRTRTNEEIDLILELKDGKVIAVEVKSGTSPSKSDFKHISTYKKLAGKNFACGIVFYTGERAIKYEDDLIALPIDCLWE
jgi:predicted AAA+ superfamily ATPase